MSLMKQMLGNSYLFGANAPFIEELYESYLENPASVTEVWRDYFDRLQNLPGGAAGRDVAHAPVVASFAQRAKLGTLQDNQVTALVDLAGLGPGQYKLPAHVDTPASVAISKIAPLTVEVRIR